MLRRSLASLLLLAPLLLPAPARAAPHLRWDACFGDPAASVDNEFSCDTNVGRQAAVLSFWCPDHIPGVVAFEMTLDLISQGPTLPPWWNASACHQASFIAASEFDFAWTACSDPFGAQESAILSTPVFPAPNREQLRVVVAKPSGGTADIGPESGELYLAHLLLTNAKTTGVGACDGCSTPVCIALNEVRVDRPAGVGDFKFEGYSGLDQQFFVTWHHPDTVPCPAATPAVNATWGQIKASYR